MSRPQYEDGDFYQLPNNIHRSIKSPFTFAVLCKLIQHVDSNGHCFPGQDKLAQGFMSTRQVKRATE